MIYDADGTCIGCVGTAYEKEKKVARWIDANDPERSFSETAIRDQRLRGFLQGLLDDLKGGVQSGSGVFDGEAGLFRHSLDEFRFVH